ncbi:tRNA (adenosine(37)-N6)-threonylcarbamoyltransferase complex dimerization subunit type 1 TsaB [Paenirhodobacter enshiensis]|uniref:Peptidase M22 n=1 Tax=Paenirhodobacter enshiensis TaxID=1105367 RepID=A0A086Y5U7_9RHOB|nr:tRNA (adenosine(37)-N6)-threonylcarbamoyltransferase complex dimerization subunit type 1 TsaB [Paenirhodobacter enshiensis]KFI29647.1 peptidase M22 [Paenirhodobacter enshiensis]
MPSDHWTLGFDTSAAHCAAALLRAGELVAECHEDMARGQAERLMPLLEEMLAGAGIGWRDLSALGVGIGPGNFTGVRISVAAARGLALALRIPAIGVSTLEARAFGLPRPVLTVDDARRGEAYVQRFTDVGESAPDLCALTEIAVTQADALTGTAADALHELRGTGTVRASAMPLAVAIARIAALRAQDGTPLPRPAPLYLRGADALPPSDPPPQLLDA